MILMLLLAIALPQRAGALQPGTGIVTGVLQFENGGGAAGVRVSAVPIDDPSSLISVAETDSAGRYRLINIPVGEYFIVAGRLDNLTYFPGGTDRSKAIAVRVEAAKITTIENFVVPASSTRPVAPAFRTIQSSPEASAYQRIAAIRNPEEKKKGLLNFEKTYPKSTRLAEVYIELSRVYASQLDFGKANEYAERAVVTVSNLRKQTPADFTPAWQNWVASLEGSAKDNLAWVKQMIDWQQKQVRATLFGRRQ